MSTYNRLLETPEGNLIAPSRIQSVRKYPGKGVGLFDGSGEMITFISHVDSDVQALIVETFKDVCNAGRRWRQPDWSALLSKSGPSAKPAAPNTNAAKAGA